MRPARSSQGPVLIRAAESGSRCQGGRLGRERCPRPPSGGSRSRPRLRAPRTALLPGAPAHTRHLPTAAPLGSPLPRPGRDPRHVPGPPSQAPGQRATDPRPGRTRGLLCSLHLPPPAPHLLDSALQRGGAEGGGAGARTPARPPGTRAASPGATGKGPPSPATDALPRTEQEDELASPSPSCCPEAPSSPLASLRPRREQKMALSRGPSPTPAPSSDQALRLRCRVHVEVGASIRGSSSSKREAH